MAATSNTKKIMAPCDKLMTKMVKPKIFSLCRTVQAPSSASTMALTTVYGITRNEYEQHEILPCLSNLYINKSLLNIIVNANQSKYIFHSAYDRLVISIYMNSHMIMDL